MDGLYLLLMAIFVVVALLYYFFRDADTFTRKPLMTKNEEEFFRRLRKALPDHYIFPQVAFRAIVKPTAKYDTKAYTRQLAKIGSKHCDFLICDEELIVVAIVELDDRTHISVKDAVRDRLTACAGYTTVRYESKIRPSIAEIQDDFAHLLAPTL